MYAIFLYFQRVKGVSPDIEDEDTPSGGGCCLLGGGGDILEGGDLHHHNHLHHHHLHSDVTGLDLDDGGGVGADDVILKRFSSKFEDVYGDTHVEGEEPGLQWCDDSR